jgi:hypothetical protein
MGGPTQEALGLTSPETDFLSRVWTLLEADATFATKVKTTVKWDGSHHDPDDVALAQMPVVGIYPNGSTEGWDSNTQHGVLLNWEIDIRVRGHNITNAYGLMSHVRGLLVDRDNFNTLNTGTSVVHTVTAARPELHTPEKGEPYTRIVMTLSTKLRVAR